MHFEDGNLYHVYNQGNNKNQVFIEVEDYYYFLRLIRKVYPVTEIIAYNLMPNHFHVMLYADKRCLEKIKQGSIFTDQFAMHQKDTKWIYQGAE